MNTTVLTAMAAALGSLVGAAASIATTWITERTQTIRADSEWKLRERESLYKNFITEASRLTVDALSHSLERSDQFVALYGILSCIRLVSGEAVARGRSLLPSNHGTVWRAQLNDRSDPRGRRGPRYRRHRPAQGVQYRLPERTIGKAGVIVPVTAR
jgi:hypothetical protein